MQRLIIEGELEQISDGVIQQAFIKLQQSKKDNIVNGKNYTLYIKVNKVNKKAVISEK